MIVWLQPRRRRVSSSDQRTRKQHDHGLVRIYQLRRSALHRRIPGWSYKKQRNTYRIDKYNNQNLRILKRTPGINFNMETLGNIYLLISPISKPCWFTLSCQELWPDHCLARPLSSHHSHSLWTTVWQPVETRGLLLTTHLVETHSTTSKELGACVGYHVVMGYHSLSRRQISPSPMVPGDCMVGHQDIWREILKPSAMLHNVWEKRNWIYDRNFMDHLTILILEAQSFHQGSKPGGGLLQLAFSCPLHWLAADAPYVLWKKSSFIEFSQSIC